MPSTGNATTNYVLASINDPEPIVSLTYQLHRRGMLGGYILGLFICELVRDRVYSPAAIV